MNDSNRRVIRAGLIYIPLFAAALWAISPRQANAQVDENYGRALQAAVDISTARSKADETRSQSLAASLRECRSFTGELAQVMCAAFATGTLGSPATGARPGESVTLPAPPPPPKPAPSWVETVLAAPAATLNALSQFAPSIAQYFITKVTSQSNERVQLAMSSERTGLYNNFAAMHASGTGAIRDVAQQGFITIGAIPQANQTTNNYDVSGQGVNFGAGNLTYNPVTNSYNPVTTNPARLCTTTPPIICQGF